MIQLFKATRGNVEKIIRLHMFTVIEDMKSRPVLSAVANQKTKTLQIGDQKFEVCDTFLHPPKLLSLFLCVCARVYVCTYMCLMYLRAHVLIHMYTCRMRKRKRGKDRDR